MALKKLAIMALAAAVLALPVSAQAQGVFDLGDISTKMGTQPAQTGQTQAPATMDALNYKADPERSKANIAKFVAGLKTMNADVGNQMEQGLASIDIFAELEKSLSKFGIRTNNMGDVAVAYWLSSWMGANGRTEEPTKAQVDGTRQMLANTFAAMPAMQQLSDADKQDTAQGMLLQTFLNETMLDGLKSNPEALQAARGQIKDAAKTLSGLDIDLFNLSENGLVRK